MGTSVLTLTTTIIILAQEVYLKLGEDQGLYSLKYYMHRLRRIQLKSSMDGTELSLHCISVGAKSIEMSRPIILPVSGPDCLIAKQRSISTKTPRVVDSVLLRAWESGESSLPPFQICEISVHLDGLLYERLGDKDFNALVQPGVSLRLR